MMISAPLDIYAVLFLTLIPITLILLCFNKKVKAYLKKHEIIDTIVDTTVLRFFWYIGNHFIDWKLSAIIAIALTWIVWKKRS